MPGFVLLVRDRADADATIRLGITVTKKIGNAVVRNRMKRRFRALGRDLLPTLGLAGADHVLIGREGGVERDYSLLREEMTKALAKASKAVRAGPVEVLPSILAPKEKKKGKASTGSARTDGGSGKGVA